MTLAVSFDFDAKELADIDPADAPAAVAAGKYCWVDLEDADVAADLLSKLGLSDATAERIRADQHQGQLRLGAHSVHATFLETRSVGADIELNTLHVVLGRGFLVTVHTAPSEAIAGVMETFRADFAVSARSGGFLLFEVADHLIGGYRSALNALSVKVEDIQKSLLGDIGDEILSQVSELTRALLDYRNAVVTAREAIDELATRKSDFVPESTQPFLDRQTVPLDRLANDSATERTVLSESLNLYMGLVSHRTNKVVNRLTILSMVFLPLNFFAAVYGMNFEHMPELGWRYSYLVFWIISTVFITSLLLIIRKKKWL